MEHRKRRKFTSEFRAEAVRLVKEGTKSLRRALQLKRNPGSSKPMPEGAVERGEQYHLAVKALFPKVSSVEVQVRNIKGKAVVDFRGIPLGQVNRLTEVLTGELPLLPKVPLLEKLLPQA